jgi:site-specific DNA-methyltransferase (adenine-specific)
MRRVKRAKRKRDIKRTKGTLYFEEGTVAIHHDDMREVLAGMEAESFTACVTDPPYELGFMSKEWDSTGIAFQSETWKAILRVLKPGGMLLAFGGTRTFHRIACAVEDAGFEVRDTLIWMYGSGFPKSLDISKAVDKMKGAVRTEQIGPSYRVIDPKKSRPGFAKIGRRNDSNENITKEYFQTAPATPQAALWQGYGTALKPAFEPIILAMKPLDGTFAENALKHGVVGVNVDGGRIGEEDIPAKVAAVAKAIATEYPRGCGGEASAKRRYTNRGNTNIAATPGPRGGSASGRWPANVILSHSPDCVQIGTRPAESYKINRFKDGAKPFGGGAGHEYESEEVAGGEVEVWACVPGCPVRMLDEQSGVSTSIGGKGSKSQHPHYDGHTIGHYLTGIRAHMGGLGDSGTASRFFYTAKASSSERSVGIKPGHGGNLHPTVKPVSLMRYLLRLVTMPSGTRVLDPFCGSGSTLVAGVLEGLDVVGVEMDEQSCGWSRDRVRLAQERGEDYTRIKKYRLKKRKKLESNKARRRIKRRGGD